MWPQFGLTLPSVGRCWSKLGNLLPISAKLGGRVGRVLAKFDRSLATSSQARPKVGQMRPELGKCWPDLGQSWPKVAQIWAMSVNLADLAHE